MRRKVDRDGFAKKRCCLYENIVAYFRLLASEEAKKYISHRVPEFEPAAFHAFS
jgi:hypothetical protein